MGSIILHFILGDKISQTLERITWLLWLKSSFVDPLLCSPPSPGAEVANSVLGFQGIGNLQ